MLFFGIFLFTHVTSKGSCTTPPSQAQTVKALPGRRLHAVYTTRPHQMRRLMPTTAQAMPQAYTREKHTTK